MYVHESDIVSEKNAKAFKRRLSSTSTLNTTLGTSFTPKGNFAPSQC
jgi:hypothetical protein